MELPVVDRAVVERACALYVPVCLALAGGLFARVRRGLFVAGLLGVLWCVPALLVLQRVNAYAGWWVFPGSDGPRMMTMPVELWLGWAALWGIAPVFWMQRLRLQWIVVVLAAFDLVAMPLCRVTVVLGGRWLVGEIVGVGFVLLPVLWLQRATLRGEYVRGRAVMQVLAAGLVFLYLPAEIVFATRGGGWNVLTGWLPWQRELLLQAGFVLALPGLAAVQEFAVRGGGTPIPYDPPRRLVCTGIYRYIANPMQVSCALVMLLWAVALRSKWMLVGPLICVVYSAGIAAWDEAADLERRFGGDWVRYRAAVRDWWPRWRPFVAVEATVYIARGCEPCSRVRLWLEGRAPRGLRIVDAETLPAGLIRRMWYVCGDETVEGVRAMARALEHLHLGWALVGAAMRLPVIASGLQVFADAMGFGPREVVCVAPATGRDAA